MSKRGNNVVAQLEDRVLATVNLIRNLKQENKKIVAEYAQLQEKVLEYEKRVIQLEELIGIAEREQRHLEKSVISALSNLDDVEELHSSASEKRDHFDLQEDEEKSSQNATGSGGSHSVPVHYSETEDNELEIF